MTTWQPAKTAPLFEMKLVFVHELSSGAYVTTAIRISDEFIGPPHGNIWAQAGSEMRLYHVTHWADLPDEIPQSDNTLCVTCHEFRSGIAGGD